MAEQVQYPLQISRIEYSSADVVAIGFDPSTKMLGWSAVNESGDLLYAESIKLSVKEETHEDEILSKMVLLSDVVFPHIKSVLDSIQYKDIKFGIEHFTYAYIGTKQKTIVALSAINYFIQYLIFNQFKHVPTTVYPITARKQSGIVKEKFDKTDIKELVFHRMMVIYDGQVDSKLFDTTKKYRKDSGLYDVFDSLVVARSLVI
jgi:Holliday junction resolvasome RuvABC endonuclease subunit